jgi:hypothetical protein
MLLYHWAKTFSTAGMPGQGKIILICFTGPEMAIFRCVGKERNEKRNGADENSGCG